MVGVRVASFNVENLFARPKAFDRSDPAAGEPILAAYGEFNALIAKPVYADADRKRMRDLFVTLDIYFENDQGAIRRRDTREPRWAWLRKNRGTFDTQPTDVTKDVEIVATGRSSWLGWAELAVETVDEATTRFTARVIDEVSADIIGTIEVEDRPALRRFNRDLVGLYRHVMVVDGNDERGIDVGLMTKTGFDIKYIRSHVDDEDVQGEVFSRDCADYEIEIPGANRTLHVLVNHFKSQSGGGGAKRKRQAAQLRLIVDELVASGESCIVLGDFNEGQADEQTPSPNFLPLFDPAGSLTVCYDLPQFDVGPRPGTFDSCGIRNRLDYIFISADLAPNLTGGGLVRSGLWGIRKTRPTDWFTYPELDGHDHQASDHAAVFIDLAL